MSRFGFEFLRDLASGPDPVDVGLEERGYLYLAPTGGAATLREVHAVQRAEGAEVALLDRAELAGRFPWMSVDDVEAGSLGLAGEGWFDGFGLLQALRRRALGARRRVRARTKWSDCDRGTVGSRRSGWHPAERIACGTVVNAAGPWAREVAAMAGVDLPVEARRRCVFVFDVARVAPRLPARDRHVGRLVPSRGRVVHLRHVAAGRGGPGRPAARGRPAPVRRAALAGARGARAGVRCDQAGPRVGGLLRVQHRRPERDPRPPPGVHEPAVRERLQRARHPAGAGRGPGRRPS